MHHTFSQLAQKNEPQTTHRRAKATPALTLSLLMPWVCTGYVNHAAPANDLAVFANPFHAGPYLHFAIS